MIIKKGVYLVYLQDTRRGERSIKMLSKRDEHIGCYLTFRITMYVLTCSTFFIADEISPPNVVKRKY